MTTRYQIVKEKARTFLVVWVIPRRLNFICRRFGIICLFHLHRQVDVKNELGLRNVGYL